ncbi:MAG: SDR family oxidoreductase [Bryobacterales bacterium]|nr:SDR family oxidoreductase [Bryobacterales bacterium]
MKILVVGGTLFIGKQLVANLLKDGHDVTVMHRRPKHDLGRRVQNLIADRNDPKAVRDALAGRFFDAIFDNVYDWERGTTSQQVEALVHACGDRLQRYVFMSSVAAYGDGLNHHEGDPLAPDDHPDLYVRNKAMTERMLFLLHQRTGFPVVTLRPPFVYGPGNPFYREAFFWDRLRDNRPIILPGDGHRLMQFVYVKDLVLACQRALTEPGAVGEAFNIANDKPVTQFELVNALGDAAGKKPDLVRVPRDRIAEAGGSPMAPPLYFGFYFDIPAITEVVAKVKRILGVQPTPFDQGLAETYQWYKRNHKREKADYAFEDRLISLARPAAAD